MIGISSKKIIKFFLKKKGAGFWLWKSYFIKRSLETLNVGDYLFYSDAGAYFVRPADPLFDLIDICKQDVIPFELQCLERQYTKRDAFILMNCDQPEFYDTKQRLATFSVWKKSDFSMNFIDQWLSYACDERLITDIDNTCGYPNYDGFIEHRHDQSIFSLLTKIHGLNAYREPSQWGSSLKYLYPDSNYDPILMLTRKKNLTIDVMIGKIKKNCEIILMISTFCGLIWAVNCTYFW